MSAQPRDILVLTRIRCMYVHADVLWLIQFDIIAVG